MLYFDLGETKHLPFSDLKPHNVGFTADGTLKLFDFGLAACVHKKHLSTDAYIMTGYTGTVAYMAPEVALRQPYNEKVGVYSFGILLWQVVSGKTPFAGMDKEQFMQKVVLGSQRPSLSLALTCFGANNNNTLNSTATAPPSVSGSFPLFSVGRAPSAGLARLLDRCWAADFNRRPDFKVILVMLNRMLLRDEVGVAPIKKSEQQEQERGSGSRSSGWLLPSSLHSSGHTAVSSASTKSLFLRSSSLAGSNADSIGTAEDFSILLDSNIDIPTNSTTATIKEDYKLTSTLVQLPSFEG